MISEEDQARINKDGKITVMVIAVMYLLLIGMFFIVMKLDDTASPPAIATIERVWDETIYFKGGESIGTMAELSFMRIDYTGKSKDCRRNYRIGSPRDQYKVGEKIIVIPNIHGCVRTKIIGRGKQ